jgi:predicted KAP-like P-loop ATPase
MAAKENNSAATSENLNDLSAYKPLAEPTTDILGYAPFAQHGADSICQM